MATVHGTICCLVSPTSVWAPACPNVRTGHGGRVWSGRSSWTMCGTCCMWWTTSSPAVMWTPPASASQVRSAPSTVPSSPPPSHLAPPPCPEANHVGAMRTATCAFRMAWLRLHARSPTLRLGQCSTNALVLPAMCSCRRELGRHARMAGRSARRAHLSVRAHDRRPGGTHRSHRSNPCLRVYVSRRRRPCKRARRSCLRNLLACAPQPFHLTLTWCLRPPLTRASCGQ